MNPMIPAVADTPQTSAGSSPTMPQPNVRPTDFITTGSSGSPQTSLVDAQVPK